MDFATISQLSTEARQNSAENYTSSSQNYEKRWQALLQENKEDSAFLRKFAKSSQITGRMQWINALGASAELDAQSELLRLETS